MATTPSFTLEARLTNGLAYLRDLETAGETHTPRYIRAHQLFLSLLCAYELAQNRPDETPVQGALDGVSG